MTMWRLAVVCLLALLSVACHGKLTKDKLSKVAAEFIPPDAQDRAQAPDVTWVQISFKVRRPALQFDESRINHARRNGWIVCRPNTEEWVSYLETKATPNQYVQMRTYMLYRKGIVVALEAAYFSLNEATSVRKGEAASEVPAQSGLVIAGSSTEMQFRDRAASQGLACGS